MFKNIFQTALAVFVFVNPVFFFSSCAESMPEKILAGYHKATGESASGKPRSIFFKARINQISNNPNNSLIKMNDSVTRMVGMAVYCEFPNKIYVVNEAVAVGNDGFNNERKVADIKVIQAFDGRTGWQTETYPQNSNLNKTRDLYFYEVDKLKKIVESTSAGSVLTKIGKPKYIGEQTIDYNVIRPGFGSMTKKKTHVLEALTNDGKKEVLYFDAETYLLLKTEETDLASNDKITTMLVNYKNFDSLKIPTTIIINKISAANPDTFIFEIEEFKLNAPEPAGAFDKSITTS